MRQNMQIISVELEENSFRFIKRSAKHEKWRIPVEGKALNISLHIALVNMQVVSMHIC